MPLDIEKAGAIKRLATIHALLTYWPIENQEVKEWLEAERTQLVEQLEDEQRKPERR